MLLNLGGPALRKHRLRRLGANDEYAADAVRCLLIVDRAVAVGPVNVVEPAAARDRHELILVPGCTPPDITWSICGPIMSHISAQTSRAGLPSEPGCR